MIDLTPNESATIRHGGKRGGTYLESLGKTDLVSLSEEEWLTFIDAIITGYGDHLRDIVAKD